MKLKQLRELGLLREKTLEEMDVDFGSLLVSDEFNRKTGWADPDLAKDYRERAIERLIRSGHEFATDANIGYKFRQRFVRIVCPYCGEDMPLTRGGGGGGFETDQHDCPQCKARIRIEYPAEHAVYVTPPPQPAGEET